ncbi:MAG TPA: hypothetical protein VGL91_24165 [Acidobacteriota bacterium]|jgi:hypothetical protein
MDDIRKAYSVCIGTSLEVLGLIGFVSRPVAGVIGTNVLLSFIHLVVGALGWFGLAGLGKTYSGAMGTVLFILGVLGFIPACAGSLHSILGINAGTSALHALVGGVSLAMAFGMKE